MVYRRLSLLLGLLLLLLLVSTPAFAQTADSYTFRAYGVGATQPIQSPFTFQAGAVQCNQPVPAAPSTVNPTRLVWIDPANPALVCIWTDPGTGPLFSAPISTTLGQYEGTLTATNTGGTSAESNRAPFSRVASLAAPAGFRLIR